MKSLDKIPVTKIQRASKILKMGTQVGANYVKYVGNKIVSGEEKARKQLNESNAEKIYDGLSELKGSALKMAQMMSMDENFLPSEFVERFSLSQFNVPPLSGPLVRKTLRTALGDYPENIFDEFNYESSYAASIGQVHRAKRGEQTFAVKVQYPGVADSISSDLKLVKPFALRMFNIKGEDVDQYFEEVESKLLEETNYELEAQQLQTARAHFLDLPFVRMPQVFPDFSSQKVITMEWMEGLHLSEYKAQETDQQKRNQLAQSLWDFYMYQVHVLKKVHADPHPGNFLVNSENELIALDFGCMKELPDEFYEPYFKLTKSKNIENREKLESILSELNMLRSADRAEEKELIIETFSKLLNILNRPFQNETFDFGDPDFFKELINLGEELKDQKELRKLNGNRGSKHFIYVNRTLYGLFSLMHNLKAGPVVINAYKNHL